MESLQQQILKVNSHIQFLTRHQEHVRETTGIHIIIIIIFKYCQQIKKNLLRRKRRTKKWNLSKVEEESNADDERFKKKV